MQFLIVANADERHLGSTYLRDIDWRHQKAEFGIFLGAAEEAGHVVIAYEPIWAIGTGKSATKEIAEDTIAFIRGVLREMFGEVAESIRILYGGHPLPWIPIKASLMGW